jgi:hypothetical protein
MRCSRQGRDSGRWSGLTRTQPDSKNSDESEGFVKTPTRRREVEPIFDFFSCLGFGRVHQNPGNEKEGFSRPSQLMTLDRSKNSDEPEGFSKTPTR